MQLFPLIVSVVISQVSTQSIPSCDSEIYCQGDLLHTVQMAQLFNDSKTFVDLKLRHSVNETLENYQILIDNSGPDGPSRDEIGQFVNDNFEDFDEFEDWTPPDFTSSPEFIDRIQDEDIKDFAQDLVNIWPVLARKIRSDVSENPDLFSLIPVDNGFVIPGGRFKEFYYWDSYWIVRGLLLSEMYDTVRGMLENFLSIVERYGFIPNGARVYYLNRSQPPLLTAMIYDYVEATNDTEFLERHIRTIDQEVRFWLENRLINITKNNVQYTVARYDVESGSPRPESYHEDVESASFFQNEEDRIQLWADLKTGAETGQDYSSRWIVDDDGGNTGNRTFLKTRRIIPVDLNAILCQAFRQMVEFYILLGDAESGVFWYQLVNTWQRTIQEVFYDEIDGIWYDWDLELSQPRKYFYPANFAPLWADAYSPRDKPLVGQRAAQYLEDQGIMDYYGGIPSSLSDTGEQWDFPNAWAALLHWVIVGLEKSEDSDAIDKAKELGQRWVRANRIGYNETGLMFEKYDATNPGKYSNGGEYVVQSGFGWTNGVALDFINLYFT